MTTYIDKVTNALTKLKNLGDGKDKMAERE